MGLGGSREGLTDTIHEEEVSHGGLGPWMRKQIDLGSKPSTTAFSLDFFGALTLTSVKWGRDLHQPHGCRWDEVLSSSCPDGKHTHT